jgi:hypothetical protein
MGLVSARSSRGRRIHAKGIAFVFDDDGNLEMAAERFRALDERRDEMIFPVLYAAVLRLIHAEKLSHLALGFFEHNAPFFERFAEAVAR